MSFLKQSLPPAFLSKFLRITLFIILPIIGFYLGLIYKDKIVNFPKTEIEKNENCASLPQSSYKNIPDSSINWQNFQTKNFIFKYPPGSRVEERGEDFFVIVENKKTISADEGISIDARQEEDFGLTDYNVALKKSKENLENINVQQIKNAVKISGIVGPGYGHGLKAQDALIKYGSGAIKISSLANIPIVKFFDEIVESISLFEENTTVNSWKTFEMKETKMTFIYPSNWVIITDPIDLSGRYHALIKDKNGSIDITWAGSEYGGGCPSENQEKYLILGEKKTICHWFFDEKEEVFAILNTSYNGQPYDFVLRLSLKNKNNAKLSSKILSSLKYVEY